MYTWHLSLQDDSGPAAPEQVDTSTTTTSAFTIQEYFARRMAERRNRPQGTAPELAVSETQTERKGGKKRRKEAKDNDVENYTQPKAKKKQDQVEWQLGGPGWDENLDASAEDGEDCARPREDQDFPPKPKKRKAKKKKQDEAAVDGLLDETSVKKKKGSK
ncbi:PIN2/TERF1-interacting telomerase inhibitor 1 [Camelus dromedarius]|uniref:PIN2/TERF1-interacting telomerase inhibitor 1 n=1 Tax=Camelus dromedarius TaxID=9838 RepID=A0A5N4CB07_CAMDR|nr:PIN2/TERF1-interacting telomerase inhibitor 1 [Camelus dromedarius]